MEKEKYIAPEMEIIAFEREDIITASDGREGSEGGIVKNNGIYYNTQRDMWFCAEDE